MFPQSVGVRGRSDHAGGPGIWGGRNESGHPMPDYVRGSIEGTIQECIRIGQNGIIEECKMAENGVCTNLKERHYKVGDQVGRYHEPLVGIKLSDKWDGPWRITHRISDNTILMRDMYGRNQKSNVDRLKPWKGREFATEQFQMGTEELKQLSKRIADKPVKKGRGRPKKEGKKVQKKVVRITSELPKKNVSAGEGRRKRKTKDKAGLKLEKAIPNTGGKKVPIGTRRSPRLLLRTAVT